MQLGVGTHDVISMLCSMLDGACRGRKSRVMRIGGAGGVGLGCPFRQSDRVSLFKGSV